jgi:hypothetical protein
VEGAAWLIMGLGGGVWGGLRAGVSGGRREPTAGLGYPAGLLTGGRGGGVGVAGVVGGPGPVGVGGSAGFWRGHARSYRLRSAP